MTDEIKELTNRLNEAQYNCNYAGDGVRVVSCGRPATDLDEDQNETANRQQPCRHHQDSVPLKEINTITLDICT